MTVSLALRSSPTISSATAKRVKSAARALGYVPDPRLSELMSQLRTVSQTRRALTIALVVNETESDSWKQIFTHRSYVEGARARAEELGYRTEEFCLFADGMSGRRLTQVLLARGIEGVVIFPLISRSPKFEIGVDWSRFSLSTCGYSLASPMLHRSCIAHMRGAFDAYGQLAALGYKRIGLVLDHDQERRAGYNWSAGVLAAARLFPGTHCVDILSPETLTVGNFCEWFREQSPDAVMHIGRNGDILAWLKAAGAQVPDKVGYVFLDLWPHMAGKISGLGQHSHEVGAAALDLVAAGMRNHEIGLPVHPKIILTDAAWCPGATTRSPRLASPAEPDVYVKSF